MIVALFEMSFVCPDGESRDSPYYATEEGGVLGENFICLATGYLLKEQLRCYLSSREGDLGFSPSRLFMRFGKKYQ
jgi:hypothetical protein